MAIPKYKDPKTGKWNRITAYGQSGNAVEIIEISGETVLSDDIITELKNDLNWISYGGGAYRFVSAEEDKRLYSYITEDKISQILVNTLTKTCILRETQITAASVADSIVKRDSYGEIPVSTPSRDSSATNKAYVDEADKTMHLKLSNLEQALNGYILDTTKEAYADLDSAVLKDSVAVGNNVYPIADKTRALVTRIEGKTTKMVQLLDKSTFPATQTVNGVTFTNNGDGTITVNGTATDDIIYAIQRVDCQNGHKYFLSGCPSGGSENTYFLWFGNRDVGNGTFVNINDNNKRSVAIRIQKDVVVSKLIYTPKLFDLTAMNREDITTVEQFKAEFPDLYSYENGNIYPAKISGVKFTGKNLFNPSTPKYSGASSFVLNGDEIVVSQTAAMTYISANFELPNAKFLIGKKISISAKVKTSGQNNGVIRVLWAKGNAALPGLNIISTYGTGAVEKKISGSGIVADIDDDTAKLCLFIYSNGSASLSESKTYTATYSNIQVEISDAPTAYEPYTEPVSVTLPETYDLHGLGDYKDYLEITKNENNELYTLKKVQVIDKHVFDGTETWAVYNRVNFENVAFRTTLLADKYTGWYNRGNLMNLLVNIKTLSADKKGYTHGDNSSNIYISLPNIATSAEMKAHVLAMYEAGTPYVFYGAIQTPVETVIATNLTYEQVTAIRHNGGLIEVVGNTNKAYAKPTIKNTVVYRLTATNTAEG